VLVKFAFYLQQNIFIIICTQLYAYTILLFLRVYLSYRLIPLRTKLDMSDMKTQIVPQSKHSHLPLYKPIIYYSIKKYSLFVVRSVQKTQMPVSLYSYALIMFNVTGNDSVRMPAYWGGGVRRGAGMVCIWKESSLTVMNWEAHNRNVHKYFRGRR
jgi:hypothetical protein